MSDLEHMTIKEAREAIERGKQLAAELSGSSSATSDDTLVTRGVHASRHVLVCTDKRGVVFGETCDVHADPITLKNARMCLRWSSSIGGVFGLAENGPTDASTGGSTTISAVVPSVALTGITAVFEVTDAAIKAWQTAPVAGRK